VRGQIAHLDHDPSNSDEDNLAFLCHDHHDEYDGKTSTSKGLREAEVREWRDDLYQEMEWRFRKEKTGKLVLFFDDARHSYRVNDVCKMMRVSVRNEGEATVKNVVVKINDIIDVNGNEIDNKRQFLGLRLGVVVSPHEDFRHPVEPPESSVIMHPGEEKTYDLVRHQAPPGNTAIIHSGYLYNPQHDGIDQKPRTPLPSGHYQITLSVQGDNLHPAEQVFEFFYSEPNLIFRKAEKTN